MSEGEALGFALDREKAALTHVNNLLKRSSGSSADRGSSAEPLVRPRFSYGGEYLITIGHNVRSFSE
jgi:hypothetical protein